MAFWNITAKDLYLIVRDRRTATNLLLLPLAFITIIGLTTGQLLGWRVSNQTLKIAFVDSIDYDAIGSSGFLVPPAGDAAETAPPEPLDEQGRDQQRNIARHLRADLLNGIQRASGVEVRSVEEWETVHGRVAGGGTPEEKSRAMVRDEQVNAVLLFKPDFYRNIYHLQGTDLIAQNEKERLPAERLAKLGIEIVNENPDSSTASAISAVVGYQAIRVLAPVLECRARTVAERAAPKFRRLCGPVERMATEPPPELEPPKQAKDNAFGNQAYQELVPSYTVMFVFFLVNLMARSFLGEQDLGTLRRLRAAPISGWSILLGKTLPFLVLSLAQTTVLFVAGKLLFGMSWGPQPWLLLPVIFATSCAATGLGLLIATLVKSDAQVSAYATTTVIILAGISGCFMPRKWLPDVMQQISLGTPHAWALIAYDQILSTPNPNVAVVWQCVGALLGFAAGFFVLGGLRFRSVG